MVSYELPNRLVIDGGLGSELSNLGYAIHGDELWSARLLDTCPDAIKQVHNSYLHAGADVIITASYQASIDGFVNYCNKTVDEAVQLIKASVDIALSCRDTFWSSRAEHSNRMRPLVAGSVGPLGACLHDGSEYSGNYVDNMSIEELMEWHRPRVRILSEGGIDLIAVETMPALKEVEAIVKLLREFPNLRAWVTFSSKNGKYTCHNEEIADAWLSLLPFDQVVGIGANCIWPQHVESLLNKVPLVVKNSKRLVFYPNGDVWDYTRNMWTTEEHDSHLICSYVPLWLSLGAQWIGGCCRSGPSDITAIRNALYMNIKT